MLINNLGEFGLIERFRNKIKTDPSVIVGSGDDCAVLAFDKQHYQLFTCDLISEGVDFKKSDNLELVGRKALAVSISDIAACGGIPRHAVVTLGVSPDMPVVQADALARGMFGLAKEYHVNIVGGDISKSAKLLIDVSILGTVEKGSLVLRSGAKAGDLILVSGSLGGSIKGKHLKFTPRLKEARFLVNKFKINAMIDISDGLIQDLGHILKQSRKGALLYAQNIPLSRNSSGLRDALSSGEEFELLFTAAKDQAEKIMRQKSWRFSVIGEIMPQGHGLKLKQKNGQSLAVKSSGYRHF